MMVSIAGLAIVFTLVYLLSGGTLLERKATLYLYIPDATGLSDESPVRVDGIDVGKVKSVALSGSNVPARDIRVAMTVERAQLANIPADSVAAITSDTMIGDKFVNIASGRKGAPPVRPDGEIAYKETIDLIESLDLRQFVQRLRVVDAMVTDIEQGRGLVGQFIQTDTIYKGLRQSLVDIQNEIRAATGATSDVGKALHSDALYSQARDALKELDEALARLQSGQGGGGQFLRDPAQYEGLLTGIGDLRKAVHDLRASEFIQSDAQHAQWNKSLASIIQSIDEAGANPLLLSTWDYENLRGMARELSGTLHDFRSDPKKYLRLKVF